MSANEIKLPSGTEVWVRATVVDPCGVNDKDPDDGRICVNVAFQRVHVIEPSDVRTIQSEDDACPTLQAEGQALVEEARDAYSPPEDDTGARIRLKIDPTSAAVLIARMADYISGDPFGQDSFCFHGQIPTEDGPEPCPVCEEMKQAKREVTDDDAREFARRISSYVDGEGYLHFRNAEGHLHINGLRVALENFIYG